MSTFDIHPIFLEQVLIKKGKEGKGRGAQIELSAEREIWDVFKDKTTDTERQHITPYVSNLTI